MGMDEFLSGNDPKMRCARTVVQGVCGVVVAELPQVLGLCQLDPAWSAAIAALVMAVLSPVMAMLGDDGRGEGA